jgi:hypothetical protein
MEGRILHRRCKPGSYDHAPFGTECRVEMVRDTEVYVQMCAQEDNPRWELVGVYPAECDENLIEKEVEEFRHYKL